MRNPSIVIKLLLMAPLVAVALLLSGCAGHVVAPPIEKIVIQTVKVPVHAPCPAPADKPVRPRRVSQEHGVMPTDLGQQARILASKVLEWTTYGERADGVMTACSK